MPCTWSACSWVQMHGVDPFDLGVQELGAQIGRGVDQHGLALVLDQDGTAPPAVARIGGVGRPPLALAALPAGLGTPPEVPQPRIVTRT